ncbi:MAG: efflux RND transporter permease subunit [Myxococcota bacterium]
MAETAPPSSLALLLVRGRALCLAASLVVTLVLGFAATRLTFNFSPDNLFLSGDPALEFYLERQVPAFGAGDNVCVVALEGDLADAPVRTALVQLHHALAHIAGVAEVQSLVTAQLPDEGVFGFSPVLGAAGEITPATLERLRKDPLLTGLLVSKDLQVSALYLRLDPAWGDEDARVRVVAAMQKAVKDADSENPSIRLQLAGVPVSQDVIIKTLKRDQLTFVPLVVLIMGFLLYLSFRDLRGVLLPFLATGTATLWALGYLVLAGHEINVVNNAIIVLLLVIGIADAVHLVARFEDELRLARAGGGAVDKEIVLARVVDAMFLPCLLTTTTTAIGFGSSVVADMALIQRFGIDAAVGVLGAFVATMLMLPALLCYLPLPKPRTSSVEGSSGRLITLLDALGRFSMRRHRAVLAMSGAILCGATLLASQVSSNQRLISELPDHDASLQATRFLEERMAGIMPFDIVFAAADPARLSDPDVVRAMAKIESFLQAHPIKVTSRSYAKALGVIERALSGEAATPVEQWGDDKVRQIQLLFDLADAEAKARALAGVMAEAHGMSRITALIPDSGSSVFTAFQVELEQELAQLQLPGVTTHVSGGTVIASRGLENIVGDMSSSLLLAVAAIFAFIAVLFRSVRFGLVALVPNVLPILCALGAMTLLDVELRVATVIIFSMSLGVAVDSCVHLLARLKEELRITSDLEEAMVHTLRGAGRPVVYSVVLLLIGFAVMGLSDFQALRDFSILSGLTLGAALASCLMLVPALLRAMGVRGTGHSSASAR